MKCEACGKPYGEGGRWLPFQWSDWVHIEAGATIGYVCSWECAIKFCSQFTGNSQGTCEFGRV